MVTTVTLFYITSLQFITLDAAKILGVSWVPSRSHHELFRPIWEELSLRGHKLTTITATPIRDKTLTNLTEIDVSCIFDARNKINVLKSYSTDNWTWDLVLFVKNFFEVFVETMLSNEDVQRLIKSDAEFDIIVVQAQHPALYAFGERFNAPVVGLSSMSVSHEIYDIYGNPTHPLISPDYLLRVESSPHEHPFSVRWNSFMLNFWGRLVYHWYMLPKADQTVKKYFGNEYPYLGEICRKRASIMMTNVNFITHPIRANVPNVIEVDQVHIKKNNSLPKDLQKYLDASQNGAIYFSLGTNVPSSTLDSRVLNEIIQGFSKLPFNVLWKWEKDDLPKLPSNVLTRKFFPQQDVLAHPNIKVFVTQGGVHSIEEAIHKEVPMVGIPVFGDQLLNIRRIVQFGMGVKLSLSEITSDSFVESVMEVFQNESYKLKVKAYKSILEDQPLKGLDKVIWWIEHVIRHKGAEHLRSSAADMTIFEYFMLDVVAVLVLIIIILFFISYKIVSLLRYSLKHKLKSD